MSSFLVIPPNARVGYAGRVEDVLNEVRESRWRVGRRQMRQVRVENVRVLIDEACAVVDLVVDDHVEVLKLC